MQIISFFSTHVDHEGRRRFLHPTTDVVLALLQINRHAYWRAADVCKRLQGDHSVLVQGNAVRRAFFLLAKDGKVKCVARGAYAAK